MGLFDRLFAKVFGKSTLDLKNLADQSNRAREQQEAVAQVKARMAQDADNARQGQDALRRSIDRIRQERFDERVEASDFPIPLPDDGGGSREPWYEFVTNGVPLVNHVDFTSTNVSWVQYDVDHQSLYVAYASGHKTDGRTYRYWTVDGRLAVAVWQGVSKGLIVWDNLRIRKTLLGHRLNYALVGAGGVMPKWTRSPLSRRAHSEGVAEESGEPGQRYQALHLGASTGPAPTQTYAALGKFMRTNPVTRDAEAKPSILKPLTGKPVQE